MTFDEFNNQNQEEPIVDPNIARKNSGITESDMEVRSAADDMIAANAAKAGYKATPNANNQQQVDPVKDLGFKTDIEYAMEHAEPDDISKALGQDLERAAMRKKNEMEQFNDTLDQLGGEMTEEEYTMSTGMTDYAAMLDNPPDPLNKDLRKYKEEQIKKFRETASPEELKAMGLDKPDTRPTPTHEVKPNDNVVKMPTREELQQREDEELLSEMEEDVIPDVTPQQMSNIVSEAADKVEEKKTIDNIPTMEDKRVERTIPEIKSNPNDLTPSVDDAKKLDDDPAKGIANKVSNFDSSNIDGVDIDKELAELDIEDDDDASKERLYKEKLKNAGREIKEKVIPIANKIDIRGFAIDNRPVSINNSVQMSEAARPVKTGNWALFNSKLPITMREFKGTEIDELVKLTQGNNFTVADLNKRYQIFYDHTISNKPKELDAWLKIISVMDVKHLYGAALKASFDGIMFLPYDCTNERCNNGFITDSMDFESLVKYEDADGKAEAYKILNSTPTPDAFNLYHTEVVPISRVYAMSFKDPSIFDAQIAPLYLEPEWYDKMEDTVAIATYIDKIFVMDLASKRLRPLAIKEFRNDVRKTLKAKVLAVAKVISTLSSDEYNLISSYVEEINKSTNYVNYQLPEVYCPKCKTKIEARPSSAAQLLFTRHRLTSLAVG